MSVIANIWKITELRQRILFTLGLVCICRMMVAVPTPGVNVAAVAAWMDQQASGAGGGLMGMFNVFTGGALAKVSVGLLSIWPYITASIIIQLMTAIIPTLGRMAREGESGRQKLNQTTRYLALALCAAQSFGIARGLLAGDLVYANTSAVGFTVLTVLCLTTATMLTMWLGEQITERGIGNGTSIIIMVNICSSLPAALKEMVQSFIPIAGSEPRFNIFHLLLLSAITILVFAGTICLTQGARKVPIHTARRTIGSKSTGGGSTYFPMRVNYTGVMPVIFAQPILGAVSWVFRQVPDTAPGWISWMNWLGNALYPSSGMRGYFYLIVYSVLILFFCFFWVATQFNAVQIADDFKRGGSYVPGIRPGMPTAQFLDMTMTRVTLIGAVGLITLALIPSILQGWMNVPGEMARFMGGTSLLIIVGVALDTMRVIESYLVMRNYDGFIRHGRLRGRNG